MNMPSTLMISQRAVGGAVVAIAALVPMLLPIATQAEPATPGDIVVERDITPHVAYRGEPKDNYPIGVAVAAFPMTPFNAAMSSVNLATDSELGARGSLGLIGSTVQAGVNPVMGVLVGNARGGNGLNTSGGVGGALGSAGTGAGGGIAGLGTMIPSVINSALAPLSSIGATGVSK